MGSLQLMTLLGSMGGMFAVNMTIVIMVMNARFQAFGARFQALDGRFQALDARLEGIETRLGLVEQDVREIRTLLPGPKSN